MRLFPGLLATILVAVPLAGIAASVQIDFQGSAFTTRTGSGGTSILSDNFIDADAGDLVLATPLGANLVNAAVIPMSWSFDASTQFGSLYLTSNNPFAGQYGNAARFLFSTNARGVITGWGIDISGGILGGTNSPSFASLSLGKGGDTFAEGFASPACAAPPEVAVPCYTLEEGNSASGAWRVENSLQPPHGHIAPAPTFAPTRSEPLGFAPKSAPEMDPSSSGAAILLLLGGLTLLRGPARTRSGDTL